MNLKTYSGPDMATVLANVKAELGPDAVIVATREVRKPGLMREGLVEVTAALDMPTEQATPGANRAAHKYAKADAADPLRDELRSMLRDEEEEAPMRRKDRLARLSGRKALATLEPEIDAAQLLETAEIDDELATEILDGLRGNDAASLTRALSLEIARYTYPGINKRSVIALVGPTGVGKTTTIAKIAAVASLVRGKKVALITADTFRVGAGEQLATYAELMGVPCTTVNDRAQLERALAAHRDCDLVLVDTAGRGVRDGEHLVRLAELFRGTEVQMWLTLTATTRNSELIALTKAYDALNLGALVVTKLDEAAQLGTVVNAAYRTRLPLAYVTNGQRVPEDIARPSPAMLADNIVRAAINADAPLDSWTLEIGSEVQSWS